MTDEVFKRRVKHVYIHVVGYICLLIVVGMVGSSLLNQTPLARDDTDPGDWGARSGMGLYTDAKTGCQYLSARGYGITPRLDRDGKHICN